MYKTSSSNIPVRDTITFDILSTNLVASGAVHTWHRLALIDVHLAVLAGEATGAEAVVVADAIEASRAVLAWDCWETDVINIRWVLNSNKRKF